MEILDLMLDMAVKAADMDAVVAVVAVVAQDALRTDSLDLEEVVEGVLLVQVGMMVVMVNTVVTTLVMLLESQVDH